MAWIRSRRGQARQNLHRERRPDAAYPDQFFKERLFVLREKSVERQGVFSNVRMDAQRTSAPASGKRGKGGNRNGDVVSHAAGFHDGLVGMLLE